MCKAFEDMRQEGYDEGIEKGMERGIEKGIEQGIVTGKAEGIIETGLDVGLSKQDILERLQKKLDISLQKAQEYFLRFGR